MKSGRASPMHSLLKERKREFHTYVYFPCESSSIAFRDVLPPSATPPPDNEFPRSRIRANLVATMEEKWRETTPPDINHRESRIRWRSSTNPIDRHVLLLVQVNFNSPLCISQEQYPILLNTPDHNFPVDLSIPNRSSSKYQSRVVKFN